MAGCMEQQTHWGNIVPPFFVFAYITGLLYTILKGR